MFDKFGVAVKQRVVPSTKHDNNKTSGLQIQCSNKFSVASSARTCSNLHVSTSCSLTCSRVRSSAWRIQQATSIIHGENSRASAPALVYTSLLLILVFICALCALIDKAILLFLCRLALPVARAITAEHEVVAQEAGTVGAGSAV